MRKYGRNGRIVYPVSTTFDLTAVFESVEDGWVQARIQELPGVITAAPTLEEAKAMLTDALHEYLLAVGQMEAPGDSPNAGERARLAVTLSV